MQIDEPATTFGYRLKLLTLTAYGSVLTPLRFFLLPRWLSVLLLLWLPLRLSLRLWLRLLARLWLRLRPHHGCLNAGLRPRFCPRHRSRLPALLAVVVAALPWAVASREVAASPAPEPASADLFSAAPGEPDFLLSRPVLHRLPAVRENAAHAKPFALRLAVDEVAASAASRLDYHAPPV